MASQHLRRSGHRLLHRAIFYTICDGCTRPSGQSITLTNPNYQTYKGVDITMNKRYSHNWQGAMGITIQDNPQ